MRGERKILRGIGMRDRASGRGEVCWIGELENGLKV